MLRNKKTGLFTGTMIGLSMAISSITYAQEGPIRISYIEPLSGPFANVGDAGLKHFRFAAEKINEEGGILGRDVEIVAMDNKQSPSESVQLVQRSVDQGIHYVTQGNGSNVAGAIIESVITESVAMVSSMTGAGSGIMGAGAGSSMTGSSMSSGSSISLGV